MKNIFTRKELEKKFCRFNWIFAYEELIAAYDKKYKMVMLIEDYMQGVYAEAWRVYHFKRTSPLVVFAKREGTKSIFYLKEGSVKLNLVPSFSPIGISKVQVRPKEIDILYSGIGGGGVSAAYCRGLAKGVKKIRVLKHAGGNQHGKAMVTLPRYNSLIIGVDDTDTEKEGATYALAHNIAKKIADRKNIRYISHVNTQLYPENPNKTKNCMSTSIGFLVKPGLEDKVIKLFKKELAKGTLSDETGLVVLRGFYICQELKIFIKRLRTKFFKDLPYAKKLMDRLGIEYHVITGEKGLIGALGAICLHDNPDLAASLPPGFDALDK